MLFESRRVELFKVPSGGTQKTRRPESQKTQKNSIEVSLGDPEVFLR